MASIDPMGGAKAFDASMQNVMRLQAQQLAERERQAAAREKSFALIKELNDALAEKDPSMRRARLNEAAVGIGLNPRDPAVKLRIDTLAKADESTRNMMRRRAAGIATEATPKEIEDLVGGALGGQKLEEIEKGAMRLQSRKLLKRIEGGKSSVNVEPAPENGGLSTGRVAAAPAAPPMQAAGPISGVAPPAAQLGTTDSPQPRIGAKSGTVGSIFKGDDLAGLSSGGVKTASIGATFAPPPEKPFESVGSGTDASTHTMDMYKAGIADIESGGDYQALGPVTSKGDRAYGKYQVMGDNIPMWTKHHLGRKMTPREFLNDPEAQDRVFEGQFGRYVNDYGPEGAAKAWHAGERGMKNAQAADQLGTRTSDYSARFMETLSQGSDLSSEDKRGAPSPATLNSTDKATQAAQSASGETPELLREVARSFQAMQTSEGSKTAETLLKRADDLEAKAVSNKASASSAQDRSSGIAEQRSRISRLTESPGLDAITGLGAREVDVGIPMTDTKIGGSLGDLSSIVGQVLGMVPGLGAAGKKGNDIATARSEWQAIQSSGLLEQLKSMQAGSSQGATGFGALDKGEREAIIAAYTAIDPRAGPEAFTAGLIRLDERLKAAQAKIDAQQADLGNAPPKIPPANSPEQLDAAKAELAKGAPRQPAGWESPQAALEYLMGLFGQ